MEAPKYDTQREKLAMPQYGRNVHAMVAQAKAQQDPEKRAQMVKVIIEVMGNRNPQFRDIQDFKQKMWLHFAIMSNFEMLEYSPYPIQESHSEKPKPDRIPYNTNRIRYRHYGKTIEHLIELARTSEDKEFSDHLSRIIANHMKKSYIMWNREVVSDEMIFQAIHELSNGEIELENIQLTSSHNFVNLTKNKKQKPKKHKRKY